jgi:hypothetical protein
VDSAPPAARVALNAGQFDGGGPWGWVVHEGAEWRAPGTGALAPAVVVDTAGRVRLVPPDSIAAVRAELGRAACARRSSRTPRCSSATARCRRRCRRRGAAWTWRTATRALRSACCATGRVLVALTRFAALGETFDAVPFGPTVPEMAALLGALGAGRAVLLDGGLSGQLLVREDAAGMAGSRERAWRGLRPVPLGLVVTPR